MATAEDLAALVMSPINNALIYARARRSAPEQPKLADAGKNQVPPIAPGNDDSLVLVGLDGFAEIQDRDGPQWAQALVSSMQSQISDGLREADGVYQIDDELLAVLLPRTSVDCAAEVTKKVRVLIAGLHLKDGVETTQLTACMGIAGTKHASTAEEVFASAKEALRRASPHPSPIRFVE